MQRIVKTLVLVAAFTALPGCVFAVGSKLESDQSPRLEKLEKRISTAEGKLGITPPAPMPAVQE